MKDRKEQQHRYHLEHKEEINARQRAYYKMHRRDRRAYLKVYKIGIKEEVLSHYGKGGNLHCSWNGCDIQDPDMLTIDHIADNGAAHRKATKLTSHKLYRHLRDTNYPDGYQTLCWNHQWKKEILRRRKKSSKPMGFVILPE